MHQYYTTIYLHICWKNKMGLNLEDNFTHEQVFICHDDTIISNLSGV